MPLEKQVCSLEWSKKLKELGVPQKSYFYWIDTGNDNLLVFKTKVGAYLENGGGISSTTLGKSNRYAAFTVAELGEILKNYTGIMPAFNSNYDGGWYYRTAGFVAHEQTEANTRAAILAYLIENKLITI